MAEHDRNAGHNGCEHHRNQQCLESADAEKDKEGRGKPYPHAAYAEQEGSAQNGAPHTDTAEQHAHAQGRDGERQHEYADEQPCGAFIHTKVPAHRVEHGLRSVHQRIDANRNQQKPGIGSQDRILMSARMIRHNPLPVFFS